MLNHTEIVQKTTQMVNAYEGHNSVFVFYADFAEFKLVNYYYGIEKGDELLDAVISFVRNIPEVALCERIFSDQFVFVVFSKAKRSNKEIMAFYERFAEEFLETQRDKYPACNLRFCCGIAPIENRNVIAAIDNANIARVDAKKWSSPTAVLFTKTKLQELAEHQKKEREIILALHENRFVFYLQPKVDLRTGEIVGAEALARRKAPSGEMIYPDNFIPIMEENGSIVDLDYMIFEQVCQHLSERMEKGLPVVHTSINMSRLHIQNKETAHRYHAIARRYHIPPSLLEFELTESVFLREYRGAIQLGKKLRDYGYSLSVDDFGSGYTGVNIFLDFDFDVLKLDRRFLSDDTKRSARNAAVIPDVVDIAEKLNIRTICEGVERLDQCEYLLSLGCHYAQGYCFSRPVPPEAFYQRYQELGGRYPVPTIAK